jgi:hypothetical protein
MSTTARAMAGCGAAGRLSYALGLLLVPDTMAAWRLGPEHASGYGRMTTRAFGAVHVNVALATLRAAVLDRPLSGVLALNIGCDFGDLVATLLEWRRHDLPVRAVLGSSIVQSIGVATWVGALRAAGGGDPAD